MSTTRFSNLPLATNKAIKCALTVSFALYLIKNLLGIMVVGGSSSSV
jgi:hypothetical protein